MWYDVCGGYCRFEVSELKGVSMAEPIGEFITASEGARLTGYTSFWIRELCQDTIRRKAVIRGHKIGGRWLVHKGDLLKYKEEMDKLGTEKHIG